MTLWSRNARLSAKPGLASFVLALCAAVAACRDSSGPDDRSVRIAVAAGDAQFGVPGQPLEDPLRVRVTDLSTQEPAEEVEVTWRVVSGNATVTPGTSTTDALGFAEATLRLGNALGAITVEATVAGAVGGPARFTAHAVAVPVIESISPTSVQAGGTVTITGTDFPANAADATVLFDRLRGEVISADGNTLTVTVPQCVLTRTVEVRVQLGSVASEPVEIQTIAGDGPGLDLAPGEAATFRAPEDYACLRFDDAPSGSMYLVVPQNVSDALGLGFRWELNGHIGAGEPVTVATASPERAVVADWELALRMRERELFAGAPLARAADRPAVAARTQEIGQRRSFNVLTPSNDSERITAELRAISERAVLYVDLEAPSPGFTREDLERFGALFDDPIYATDVSVFGEPSDIDGNGKIVILFTPKVNALTEEGEDSFIAGYFFGCDLVTPQRCSDSNQAEIFYSMVPDPQGEFGDARSKELVLNTVPGILAHEFQHMIHFGQKGSLDVLWLSEGLAHAAEDIVGRVFLERGDEERAVEFMRPNHVRANRYLGAVSGTSLLREDSPGTLQLRGGAWLLVDHLASHYGGHELLGRLTRSEREGVDNVTTETGQPWHTLLGDFALALWADNAPELRNVTIDPRFTFPKIDLRLVTGQFAGGFPLQPTSVGFQDFQIEGTLASASQDYVIIRAPAGPPPPFHLSFTGVRGGPFPEDAQLSILRIR